MLPRSRNHGLWTVDLAGLGTCALLAAAWYFLGVGPLTRARAARVQLEHELQIREHKHETLAQSRARQQERLASLKAEVDQSSVPLQSHEEINTRVKEVAQVAGAAGLRLDEIRPGSPASLQHYTAVPIRLAGQGGYQAAAAFLHQIHESYRDIGVTGLDLRGEPEAPDKPTTFAIQLLWYAAPATDSLK